MARFSTPQSVGKYVAASGNSLVFPSDLFSTAGGAYKSMMIQVVESKPVIDLGNAATLAMDTFKKEADGAYGAITNGTAAKPTGKTDLYHVNNLNFLKWYAIPLPNQLSEIYSHEWGEETGAVKAMTDKLTSEGALKDASTALSRIADSTGAMKAVVDPQFFKDYKSSKPREFNFSIDLMPKTAAEGQLMMQLVRELKMWSAPMASATSAVLIAPTFFIITFSNPVIQDTVRPKPVVLSRISLDYGPSGFIETTLDGVPKVMRLELTFLEKEAMVMGDWM